MTTLLATIDDGLIPVRETLGCKNPRVFVLASPDFSDEAIQHIESHPNVIAVLTSRTIQDGILDQLPTADTTLYFGGSWFLRVEDIASIAASRKSDMFTQRHPVYGWSTGLSSSFIDGSRHFRNRVPQDTPLDQYIASATTYLTSDPAVPQTALVFLSPETTTEDLGAVLALPFVKAVVADFVPEAWSQAYPDQVFALDDTSAIPAAGWLISLTRLILLPVAPCLALYEAEKTRYLLIPGDDEWDISNLALWYPDESLPPPPPPPPLEQALEMLLAQPPLLSKADIIPQSVVMVSASLGPGGAERQLHMTIKGLCEKGYTACTVVAENLYDGKGDFYVEAITATGVQCRSLCGQCDIAYPDQPWYAANKQLIALLDTLPLPTRSKILSYTAEFFDIRPEVAHIWQDMPEAVIAACIAGVPRVVLSWQNMAPYHFAYHNSLQLPVYKALHASGRVHFTNNSQAGRDDYASWIGMPHDAIHVLYNGMFPDAWVKAHDNAIHALKTALNIPDTHQVIGSLVRFFPEKDLPLWIQTAAHLAAQEPDVTFVIFGDGPLRKELTALAEQLGIADRLRLPGVSNNAPVAHSVLDIFLMTSKLEGVPNVLLEAQCIGTPIVTTRAGGTPEAIRHGITGLVVEERTPEALATALRTVLHDQAFRSNVAKTAVNHIRQTFSMEAMIQTTLTVYGWSDQ